MSVDQASPDSPLLSAMRRLAAELFAAYGAAARERALAIAEAIAFEGNDEVAEIWESISRLVGPALVVSPAR